MKSIRNAVLAMLLLAGCGLDPVGSRYVKSKEVKANEAAIFSISASDSPELAGTRMEIPAGALSTDTTLTLELNLTSILGAELTAGPAVVFGPMGTSFSREVTLVLPVRELGTTDDVGIVGQADDGTSYEVDPNQVALNATRTLVTFPIRQLGKFQARRRTTCTSTSQCTTGLVCTNGRCRGSSNATDAGPSCPMTCPAGQACDSIQQICIAVPADGGQAWTCAQLGFNCGPAGDGRGGILQCGTCASPMTCGGAGQPGLCGLGCDGGGCSGDVPLTCAQQGFDCGLAGDGLGGLLDCGTCVGPATCGGLGVPNRCGAVENHALSCAQQGFTCGTAGDGMGGTIDCGTCASPLTCGGAGHPNVCESPDGGVADAGPGCGTNLDCAIGQSCINGQCQ